MWEPINRFFIFKETKCIFTFVFIIYRRNKDYPFLNFVRFTESCSLTEFLDDNGTLRYVVNFSQLITM